MFVVEKEDVCDVLEKLQMKNGRLQADKVLKFISGIAW